MAQSGIKLGLVVDWGPDSAVGLVVDSGFMSSPDRLTGDPLKKGTAPIAVIAVLSTPLGDNLRYTVLRYMR